MAYFCPFCNKELKLLKGRYFCKCKNVFFDEKDLKPKEETPKTNIDEIDISSIFEEEPANQQENQATNQSDVVVDVNLDVKQVEKPKPDKKLNYNISGRIFKYGDEESALDFINTKHIYNFIFESRVSNSLSKEFMRLVRNHLGDDEARLFFQKAESLRAMVDNRLEIVSIIFSSLYGVLAIDDLECGATTFRFTSKAELINNLANIDNTQVSGAFVIKHPIPVYFFLFEKETRIPTKQEMLDKIAQEVFKKTGKGELKDKVMIHFQDDKMFNFGTHEYFIKHIASNEDIEEKNSCLKNLRRDNFDATFNTNGQVDSLIVTLFDIPINKVNAFFQNLHYSLGYTKRIYLFIDKNDIKYMDAYISADQQALIDLAKESIISPGFRSKKEYTILRTIYLFLQCGLFDTSANNYFYELAALKILVDEKRDEYKTASALAKTVGFDEFCNLIHHTFVTDTRVRYAGKLIEINQFFDIVNHSYERNSLMINLKHFMNDDEGLRKLSLLCSVQFIPYSDLKKTIEDIRKAGKLL